MKNLILFRELSLWFYKISFGKINSRNILKKDLKYIINRFGVIAGPWQFGKQDQGFILLWVAKHYLKKIVLYWIWRERSSNKRCFTY